MAVVLDIGGGYIRAGFSDGSDELLMPRMSVAAALGRAKRGRERPILIGQRLAALPEALVSRALSRGLVTDWESLKRILCEEVFSRNQRGGLGISEKIQSLNLMCITPPLSPESVNQQGVEVFLEDFKFRKVYFSNSAICVPYSPGLYAAFDRPLNALPPPCVVVDCGFSGCRVSGVVEGGLMAGLCQRSNVGGRVLNNYLRELLAFSQVDLEDAPFLVQKIREMVSKVSEFNSLKTSLRNLEPIFIKLPDYSDSHEPLIVSANEYTEQTRSGNPQIKILKIWRERSVVPECLFQPGIAGLSECGIAEMTFRSIMKAPEQLRPSLAKRILLVGGLAMMDGLKERFEAELRSMLNDGLQVKVYIEQDKRTDLSVFRGASVVASHYDSIKNAIDRDAFTGRAS